jgi:hypothetical protein
MAKRYGQMIQIVAALKPSIIVEVGVHRGLRGSALSIEALRHSHEVRYIGFDVFETMGAQFQKDALNGKRTPREARARMSFEPIVKKHPGFSYTFTIGDTRDTLHGKRIEADFAFIDGDHRVDAIRGDYDALKDAPVVVLDDYYVAGANGDLPDLSKYGANAVVDELRDEGVSVEILPSRDVCNHGAISCLAVVRR